MERFIVGGIDLGTSTSCLGIIKDNYTTIVNSTTGNRTIPSCVYYKNDDSVDVGEIAKNSIIKDFENVVYDAKRFIGLEYTEQTIQDDIKNMSYKVVANEQNEIEFELPNRKDRITPEGVSSEILKHLISNLENQLVEEDKKLDKYVIITVPANFNNNQRSKTIKAGEDAGLNVLDLINEPTAAAIAYGFTSEKVTNNHRILVYDLGGGTFDVSIIEVTPTNVRVICSDGENHLGGEDFTNGLLNYFAELYEKGTDKKLDKKQKARIRKVCDEAKCILSEALDTDLNSTLLEDADIDVHVTRTLFNEINQPLFDKTIEIVMKLLKDSNLKKEDITELVLIGGSSRIPYVVEILQKEFPKTQICRDINPDEAVTQGAVIIAQERMQKKLEEEEEKKRKEKEEKEEKKLPKKKNFFSLFFTSSSSTSSSPVVPKSKSSDIKVDRSIIVTDIASKSLGMEYTDEFDIAGKMWTFIKKGTELPFEHKEVFETTENNQDHLELKIYEGEHEFVRDNHYLQTCLFCSLPPKPAGLVGVEVTFSLNNSGILIVTAVDCETKREVKAKIEL